MSTLEQEFTGTNEKKVQYGKKQKWSFGLGSYTQWFVNSAFNTWVFSFYFTAVKLPVNYIMLAFILWTVWNSINDPLIGYLSDKIQTRWGRRKPFIIVGTVPVAILEIILWLPPTGNNALTFVYLLVMLFAYDTFYTMIALPYDSLFPELYTSVEERAEVNTIKQVLATIGLISAFLIPGLFIGDLERQSGYVINGVVTSIIVFATLVISLKWGVTERVEFKLDHQSELSFLAGLKYTFKNRGFVIYTLMFFFYEYITLLLSTTVPLYALHVLGVEDTFLTSILLGLMFIVGIFTVVIWRALDLRLGSRGAFAIALVSYVAASIPLMFVSEFIGALITVIFMGFGFGGMLYFVYLIIADVIDEDELQTGVRREGTFFGITNFFMRLSMIFSIITVSLVFTTTGWEEYIPDPSVDVVFGLRILVFAFPAVVVGLILLCLYFYPYTKTKVQEIKEKIEVLHAQKLEKVTTGSPKAEESSR